MAPWLPLFFHVLKTESQRHLGLTRGKQVHLGADHGQRQGSSLFRCYPQGAPVDGRNRERNVHVSLIYAATLVTRLHDQKEQIVQLRFVSF